MANTATKKPQVKERRKHKGVTQRKINRITKADKQKIMNKAIEILNEIFEPVAEDCRTWKDDLQLAITLNPDIDKVLEAMKEIATIAYAAGSEYGAWMAHELSEASDEPLDSEQCIEELFKPRQP